MGSATAGSGGRVAAGVVVWLAAVGGGIALASAIASHVHDQQRAAQRAAAARAVLVTDPVVRHYRWLVYALGGRLHFQADAQSAPILEVGPAGTRTLSG